MRKGTPMAVFVEDWGANYGSAYLVTPDDVGSVTAELVEDGPDLLVHDSMPSEPGDDAIAFVDGVRRGEAALWQEDDAGRWGRGVAGGHACGAVIADAAGPAFGECRVHRMIIWGSGLVGGLPSIQGGWSWAVASVADQNPDAPAKELQTRMRQQEGLLAEDLCAAGYLTIVDGPLNFVRSRDLPVVGYVKTHHRALLDPEHHKLIPRLGAGQRTSIFRLGADRYSAYLRLAPVAATSSPWSGIVRVEVPQSAGLAAAISTVDRIAGMIPRYAGVPHRDPRAPQNLQPIGALEKHLRHRLGSAALATRAVREAVAIFAGALP
jgi:hypothetical protein